MKMDPADEPWTEIYLNIYHVTTKIGKGHLPHDVWRVDTEEWGQSSWLDMPTVGARRISFGGLLETYLAEGSMERLIAEIRTKLTQDGLFAKPGK